MGKINLLDCTLRDGGYINDWNFGEKAIRSIAKKMVLTGIEYFEVGFVRECDYDRNRSIFNGNDSIKDIIRPKQPHIHYTGMIDMGKPIELETLGARQDDGFDVFRVIFKKNKIDEAYTYIQDLIELGYEVFAQPVGTDNYTDIEFIELIHKFNSLSIRAFYIVDSFGLIKKRDFLRLLQIADNNLRDDIMLGYHSHNNMQQAMGNASAMTEMNLQRDIILDACVFGMGRGAGNLNLELFAEYMNENYGKRYRIEPMLEIIDEYLNDIYRKNFWGYSLPLYLSAKNSCHPNYAIYFASKGTLTMKSYNEILKSIPPEDRVVYNQDKAEKIYHQYQGNYVDDREAISRIENELKGRKILLLGSGKSLITQNKEIQKFIENNNPIVIGLNFIPNTFKCDYAFCCHMRRYREIQDRHDVKKIITSNLREAGDYCYMLNFSSYSAEPAEIMDNSGLVCMNFLVHLGISQIAVAGLDGYDTQNKGNYVNIGLEYDFSIQERMRRNQLIKEALNKVKQEMEILFLTDSLYM